jgi:nitrogen fixation NifU-like protein
MALLRATAIAQTFYLVPSSRFAGRIKIPSNCTPVNHLSKISLVGPSTGFVCTVVPQFVDAVVQWQVRAMFSPAVLDHFKNPRNAGALLDATTTVEVTNPVCGDILRLAIKTEGNRVVSARFKTQGCVTAIACSSYIAEWLEGKSAEEIRAMNHEKISEALGGLPQATMHGAQLAEDALKALHP